MGEKRTVTVTLLAGATVPLVIFDVHPVGPVPPLQENDVNVSAAVPLFPMVNVRSAVEPTLTLPKARLPAKAMILVGVTAAVGAVVDGDDDPHAAAMAARVARAV